MIRFMIYTPVNVRGQIVDYAKDRLSALEKEIGDKITIYTPHDPEYSSDCTEEWLAPAIEKDILPDVTITHATEFTSLDDLSECALFSDLAGKYLEENPVRDELKMLVDPRGILYPVSVTPLVMIYNSKRIDGKELKHSWTDLFNEKYKVIFPDRNKPLCRAAGAFLMEMFPEQFPAFEKRVVYEGNPANMVKAVASGEYDLALTNSSFGAMAQGKGGVAINYPKEGYILLPQVLVWKKGVDPRLSALGDMLICEEIQRYLAEQGVWTVHRGVELCDSFAHAQQLANWKGWDAYIRSVSKFDKYRQ